MAIDSLDDLVAGFRPPQAVMKSTVTAATLGGTRAVSTWLASGWPGPASAPASGVNGETLSNAAQGAIPRTNPAGGLEAVLASMSFYTTQGGVLWLADRLWQNSGLSVTSTAAQAISPVALPARDANGATAGAGVVFGIEWMTTGGAGTPTVTATYTNSAGTSGKTASFTAVASPPVGTIEFFPFAAGDAGVQSVQSVQQTATRTSGTMSLVGLRLICPLDIASGTGGNLRDVTNGLPRIYDNSCLQLIWFPAVTTSALLVGTLVEAHG